MKTSIEVLETVFEDLSEYDVEQVERFVNALGALILDPLVQLHCLLSVGAVVENIRALEVGARTLTEDERERLKDLLGGP